MRQSHSEIGDVRGLGLMMAMDVGPVARPVHVSTRPGATRSWRRRSDSGLLLLGCGESAVRFCPPLCITAAQVETALRILDGVLSRGRRGRLLFCRTSGFCEL